MFAFLLCHPRSTRVKQTGIVPPRSGEEAAHKRFNASPTNLESPPLRCDNETCLPEVIMCLISCIITKCQEHVCHKQICQNTQLNHLLGVIGVDSIFNIISHDSIREQVFFFFFLPAEVCSQFIYYFIIKVHSEILESGRENTML